MCASKVGVSGLPTAPPEQAPRCVPWRGVATIAQPNCSGFGRRRLLHAGVALGAMLLLAGAPGTSAHAGTITWNGTTNADWNTNGNWSSGAKPTSTDDVTLPLSPTGGRQPSITGTPNGAAKSVIDNGTLTISGS